MSAAFQMKEDFIAGHLLISDDGPHPMIDLCQPPPKGACGQAAKCNIWTEDSGAWHQRIWRSLGFFKAAHPLLLERQENANENILYFCTFHVLFLGDLLLFFSCVHLVSSGPPVLLQGTALP